MQLSKRMQRLAGMVTEGHRLCDVGTDHGYIPIALVLQGRIPSAIAMDINKGPLARAYEHIKEQGLGTYIETRQGDGLTALKADEADTVLIAGMGGMLTIHILEGGKHCLDTVKELILQPQSDIHQVRTYLAEHEYVIAEEDIVFDEGKYYPMMKAVHGRMEMPSFAERYYGLRRCQKSPDVLRDFLKQERKKTEQIMENLRRNSQSASLRMQELERILERIDSMNG